MGICFGIRNQAPSMILVQSRRPDSHVHSREAEGSPPSPRPALAAAHTQSHSAHAGRCPASPTVTPQTQGLQARSSSLGFTVPWVPDLGHRPLTSSQESCP